LAIIGYARVTTIDQDLSIQKATLKAAGCDIIRAEKRSGTTTAGREELRIVLDFLHKGDTLVVTRIDRLARSIGDLQDIVRTVKAKGASLKATEQPIDTSTAAGKCSLDSWASLQSSRRTCGESASSKGLPRRKASTRAVPPR
jgi:DNA invertase Pin-like site-specific DNA recombinase